MSDLMNLPPDRTMPPARMLARQRLVVEHVGGPAPRRRATRSAARFVAVAVGASTLLIGGTAAAYIAFKPASVPVADETRCYTEASLEDDGQAFLGTTVAQAWAADGTRNATRAVQTCSSLWRQGMLELGASGIGEPAAGEPDHPVPSLVACTLDDGVAAVFPGDQQTCAQLGLPQLLE